MNLATKIISTFENQLEFPLSLSVLEGGNTKKKSDKEIIVEKVLSTINRNEWLEKKALLTKIESHPLYTEPPMDVSDSYSFGWYRGLAFKLETLIRGRWYAWFHIIQKGRLETTDVIPNCSFSMFQGKDDVNKMLDKCVDTCKQEGYDAYDFIEWLGYSLGIAYFSKPRISNRLWERLYNEFDISLMMLYPSDYLSYFLAKHGQSGNNGYFPTPLSVTIFMNKILDGDTEHSITNSVYEPCLGAGAMLLPSKSLNLCGTELNPTMVKATAIQAFCYSPWLLYTPLPLIGLHFNENEMRIDKYFEFNTNTRIYQGDSLLGEFLAPTDIFSESKMIDIYINALDMEKREVFQYEHIVMEKDWQDIDKEMRMNIVKAQARELGFDCCLSNPPFGKMNKFTLDAIREIEKKNEKLQKERSLRIKTPHPLVEKIREEIEADIELKLDENTGQFALFI